MSAGIRFTNSCSRPENNALTDVVSRPLKAVGCHVCTEDRRGGGSQDCVDLFASLGVDPSDFRYRRSP